MADLSHELHTPLAVLYGEIQCINRLVGDLHELSMSDLLIVKLLYGCGLRLFECLSLRVNSVP
jgi:integrase